LGIKIDDVILAGDSAGGNLISAVTSLAIQRGYKIPKALILSYPATYVGHKMFVPSLLLSLDDILLPSKFLKHAIMAYSNP
jgi:hormone-sensitive lipase